MFVQVVMHFWKKKKDGKEKRKRKEGKKEGRK